MLIKCEGLDEEQLRRVLVPTGTNLLGLVQHMTVGERYWFAHHVAGELDDEKWDFTMEVPASVSSEEVLQRFREAYRAQQRDRPRRSESPRPRPRGRCTSTDSNLRWVLAHKLSEQARHVGHADIIREQIDGVTGR